MPEKNLIDMELYAIIGKQIKTARNLKGISLDTLSELINGEKTKSTLKRYEDGSSRIEMDMLEKICNQIGLNYVDVINNAKDELNKSRLVEIPIVYNDYFPLHYSTNLSAGTLEELLESEPDAIVYVPIKYQMIKKRLHAFKVNGTSMNNIIADNSIVVAEDVQSVLNLKDGTIVVAWVNGLATVKRLYVNGNQITLMPDSSDKSHQPIMINTDIDTVSIIGRVIWHMNPDDVEKYY